MALYILLLPLFSSVLCGLFSKKISHKVSSIFSSSCIFITFIISAYFFYQQINHHDKIVINFFAWFTLDNLSVNWGFFLDQLTAIMLVVVTSVSLIVHLYSYGYMHDDPNLPRFMSYLSLFTFAMLALITANNFLQLFFGWEAVGLCSYLLIGFWYEKESAAKAQMKAFIVNRFGDFAFLIGIFLIFKHTGTLDFAEVFDNYDLIKKEYVSLLGYNYNALDFVCLMLFLGCMGKSAQIGLHVWLPDAMEGPTPVSALIHAATMVTAGVFLLARCSYLFEYSTNILSIITIIGAITALFAASIAMVQNDIKKVIAYSTCSQLGYMFMASGVSAYQAAIFHLFTHAFFKALLFLCAGNVIHALSGEQDIRKMGGIWRKIPYSYSLFIIGSIAIMGIYPFAGYYSKDLILESLYAANTQIGFYAFCLGLATAFITAYYSMRLLILVFHGDSNYSKESHEPHEASFIMIFPLVILAFGAIFSGVFGSYVLEVDKYSGYFTGSIFNHYEHDALEKAHHVDYFIKKLPTIFAALGILFSFLRFVILKNLNFNDIFGKLYNILLNKYYIDEIYFCFIVKPARNLAACLWRFVDVKVIDGFGPGGATISVIKAAKNISAMQTGYIFNYAFLILMSLVILISWFSFSYLIEFLR